MSMRSISRRRNEASAAARIVVAESPLSPGTMPTFVAITMSLRVPRVAIQRPMIVSDSPPEWPGTHAEYTSAVSMKLPPAAACAPCGSGTGNRPGVHPALAGWARATLGRSVEAATIAAKAAVLIIVFVVFINFIGDSLCDCSRHAGVLLAWSEWTSIPARHRVYADLSD